jgi:hypothetical protein
MTDFVPENSLERALLAASEGGSPDALIASLAAEALYVPAQGPAPGEDDPAAEGEQQLTAGTEVSLPVFVHEGRRLVPVFTSVTQFELGAPGAERYVRATGADLAAIWPAGHAMAVNAGGALSVAIPEEDVRGMAGGDELTIGAPAAEPEALWERLRAFAADRPEIVSAHRALVLVHAEGAEPQLVVGLVIDPDADPVPVLEACAEALTGESAVMRVDPEGDDPIGAWMLAQSAPLYER